jgi:thiol-disulfide isomerase/thioredoxin
MRSFRKFSMLALLSLLQSRHRQLRRWLQIASPAKFLTAFLLLPVCTSAAQAPVKVVNLTADWCVSCRVFEPKLSRALESVTGEDVELVTIDLTHLRSGSDSRKATIDASKALLGFHKADYIWDWYGGYTGMAILIASDTGEPISCVDKRHSVEMIENRLALADVLARRAAPGRRRPDGADCPPPLR